MKTQSLKKLKAAVLLALMTFISVAGFSQDPGGNPDGPPPAVPFDDYMYLILIAAGIVLTAVTFSRKSRKLSKATA